MKFICLCQRESNVTPLPIPLNFTNLTEKFVPDHFTPNPMRSIQSPGLSMSIINPLDILEVKNDSFYLGLLTHKPQDWHIPGGGIPDGNYALIRANEDTLELVSDVSGTHPMWYYYDEQVFIASSSQVAIISLLGSYQPNPKTYPWFLSGGHHGPLMGWDQRIRKVRSNHSKIVLDRNQWTLDEVTNKLSFSPVKMDSSRYFSYYQEEMTNLLGSINLDYHRWVLPLSGGVDSRALLLLMKRDLNLRTLSWGHSSAEKNPIGDVYTAKKLAKHFHLSHEFYPVDISPLPFEQIFDRFLTIGEGRVDAIAGYVDGFDVWNQFFDQNIEGIIRGDLPVSQMPVAKSVEEVWEYLCMPPFKNSFNKELYDTWELSDQDIPKDLQKRDDETFTEYRDRAFIEYRAPSCHGGRNDLKLLHTEVFSPLQTTAVVNLYKTLPDEYRAGKTLLNQLVKKLNPGIPFAITDSVVDYKEYLRHPLVVNFVRQTLQDSMNSGPFNQKFIQHLIKNLNPDTKVQIGKRQNFKTITRRKVKSFLPRAWQYKIKSSSQGPDFYRIAFRACMIIQMDARLKEIAAQSQQNPIYNLV